jgi:DNA-binding CsgD family transcriptional regulator
MATPLIRRGDALTHKERLVLRHLTGGHTLEEVARVLGVSRNTVHYHVKNIYRKLGVSSRAEATMAAARLGVVNF